ncbi:hypothetical protein [Limimaricola hongkongensis]|uniref:Uncharacterized protein n=1 Tax=Limimaricola hongkongensis DSM 17492 TaxID=1122180 RepID=A0A017HDB9_9RHOB|nr:hypothetical protein [Limimaricola hongkongensis]EYD71794.1 hypothetical protein Lokhon_01864 [Limimaricola hongkongensis DSM 17492]
MSRQLTDAEWLAALDKGWTSLEAAENLGRNRNTCQRNAKRLGRKWHDPTPAITAERMKNPELRKKVLDALRASRDKIAAGNVRRWGFDRLSPGELAEYRYLTRIKRVSRAEALRMIGRLDILRPVPRTRAQRIQVETALGAQMRAFLKAEGIHKPKLPPDLRDQDGPRAKRRSAVHRMVIDQPGILSREIAVALGCSPDTVDNDLAWLRNRRVIARAEAGGHEAVQQEMAA